MLLSTYTAFAALCEHSFQQTLRKDYGVPHSFIAYRRAFFRTYGTPPLDDPADGIGVDRVSFIPSPSPADRDRAGTFRSVVLGVSRPFANESLKRAVTRKGLS